MVAGVAGGYIADRLTPSTRLLFYALAGLLIALFALASKGLYYDWLYNELGAIPIAPPVLAPLLFASLLPPTFCMGLSLPLLARPLTRSTELAPQRIGMLYGFNALGAALGAFATTWSLAARLGFERCLVLGASI